MTAWKGWDTELLQAQGDPVNAETLAVVDAFQAVEGHGGNYNPFNVGPGPFNGRNLSDAPWSGTPSPYPPTLDFPGPSQGTEASIIVGESNWPTLLAALKTGHPLEQQWEIHQGAATPDAQYTEEVRNIAEQYLHHQSTYSLGDTSLNPTSGGVGGGGPGSALLACIDKHGGEGTIGKTDCLSCGGQWTQSAGRDAVGNPVYYCGGPGITDPFAGLQGGGGSGSAAGIGGVGGIAGGLLAGGLLAGLASGDISGIIGEVIHRVFLFLAGAALIYMGGRALPSSVTALGAF